MCMLGVQIYACTHTNVLLTQHIHVSIYGMNMILTVVGSPGGGKRGIA